MLLSYCCFSILISMSWCRLRKLISSSSLTIAYFWFSTSSWLFTFNLTSKSLFSFLSNSKTPSLCWSSFWRPSVTYSSSLILSCMFWRRVSYCYFCFSCSDTCLDSCIVTYSWNWSSRAENFCFKLSFSLLSSLTLSFRYFFCSSIVSLCTFIDSQVVFSSMTWLSWDASVHLSSSMRLSAS